MRLLNRLWSYVREIWFALRKSANLWDGFRLVRKTLDFHLHNSGWRINDSPFEVRVYVGRPIVALQLRPAAGDLFILYEVLMREVYSLPTTICDPSQVKTIVDCGANIGLTALYLADRYPAATIYAIEPLPTNYELLVRNTRQCPRIVQIHGCITARDDGFVLFSTDQPAWGNRISHNNRGVPVETITLHALRQRYGLATIDLLKVDIEGGEEDLFRDGSFLENVKLVIVELHGAYGVDGFQRDLDRWNFRAVAPSRSLGTRMVTALRRNSMQSMPTE